MLEIGAYRHGKWEPEELNDREENFEETRIIAESMVLFQFCKREDYRKRLYEWWFNTSFVC